MSGARVLVVDDEPQVLRALRLALTGYGYQVETAATGEEALELIGRHLPDVVLLDLMLPGIDGLEVCRRLRARADLPIIVLSARGEERLKVQALDEGADDYLTKPFGMDELLARVRVALRRTAGRADAPILTAGELRLDVGRRRVTRRDEEVALAPTEYDVLKHLMTHSDRVITHGQLLRAIWGPDFGQEAQYLRNFVLQLRRKLENDPAHPRHLLTEPGVGYRFFSSPQTDEA